MSRMSITLSHPGGDLIVPGQPDASLGHGAWVTELELPGRTWRREYAPASQTYGGQLPLSAVPESTVVATLVSIKAATSAELREQIEHLEAVLSQWAYGLTTKTDTRTVAWVAEPADIGYGPYSVGQDRMAATQLELSIPVNPA